MAMQEWQGTIFLGAEWALFVGRGGVTPLHRHLAHKIVMGLDRDVEVRWDDGRCRQGRIVPVRAGSLHRVSAPAARVGLYYADAGAFPNSSLPAPRQLKALLRLCRQLDGGDPQAIAAMHGLHLDGSCLADDRVVKAVDAMRRSRDAPLEAVAPRAGVSQRRLRHLFAASVGGAPVRYRRWRRLRVAAQRLGQGERIVDAALEAGFSDAAHLTRTFVEMLGITPGMFQTSQVIILPDTDAA